MNGIAVVAFDVADGLIHILMLAGVRAAVCGFLQNRHRAVKAAHHFKQAAFVEFVNHLVHAADEFVAVFELCCVLADKARAAQDLQYIKAVECDPHVLPRVFAVGNVIRALARADEEALVCMQRVGLFSDGIRTLAGDDVVQQVLIAHGRTPEMPALTFFVTAVIHGNRAAVIQIFRSMLYGVHTRPYLCNSLFSIAHLSTKYNKITTKRNKKYRICTLCTV